MKHVAIGVLALALSVAFLVELRVVDRVSYQIESGRLRAMRDGLVDGVVSVEALLSGQLVAEAVMPTVVSIETESRIIVSASGDDGSAPPDDGWLALLERLHAGSAPEGEADEALDAFRRSFTVEQGIGSGFVIDAQRGHVLTNAHVVDGTDTILVILADGRRTNAEVLGSDRESDLALLRIDLPDLQDVRFGDSSTVRTGEEVFAFGNPLGLSGTMSKGIVSAVNRHSVILNDGHYPGLLQTDAVISPGSSGGPLVNARGEVVGINAAIATTTGQYDGVGFAIPVNKAKPLLGDLVAGGPSILGVWVASLTYEEARAEAIRLGWTEPQGVLVREVMPGLAAEHAGVLPDDIILAVDGERVMASDDLVNLVSNRKPGTKVQVEVWREEGRLSLEVRLSRKYDPR